MQGYAILALGAPGARTAAVSAECVWAVGTPLVRIDVRDCSVFCADDMTNRVASDFDSAAWKGSSAKPWRIRDSRLGEESLK